METKWSRGHVLFKCWMLSAVRAAMQRALSQLYRHELNHRGLLQPGRKPWYLHSTLVPFEESSSGPATCSRYGMQSMGGLQSMWGLSIPLPPPYTIYKRQSVVLRMSCKPQLSLHKRIQQTGFIYKNSLQKKSWKCFVMPTKICTINCLTLWDKEWMNKATDSKKQCLYL